MSKRPSIYDLELADTIQDLNLRGRLRRCVVGDGTIDEDEYTELVAREVERTRKLYKKGEPHVRLQ